MTIKHCIITGGSSGIGLATARKLVEEGFSITLIARRAAQLAAAKSELTELLSSIEQRVITFSADVSDRNEITEAIVNAIEILGPPDILITSAGMALPGYFREMAIDVYEQSMAVNYLGTVYAVKTALPHMLKNGGNILMVSSGAGLIGLFGYTAYSPTKFALRGFAESLHAELRRTKVQVSIAYPPDTDTPQLAQENLTKPEETKVMTETAGVWSADTVAEHMINGIRKGKFAITPGFELTVLYRIGSLITPLIQWFWSLKTKNIQPR